MVRDMWIWYLITYAGSSWTLLNESVDLHEYRIGPKNTRTTPHPVTGETLPAVCGT